MRVISQVTIAGLAAVALACGGGSKSENNTSARNSSGDQDQGNRATLTGCLLAGGDAGSYVLQLASAAEETSSTPGDASKPTSAGGDWAAGRMFKVVTDNNGDLSQNLNKRVAVNGYIESGAVGTAGSDQRGTTDTATAHGTGAATGTGVGTGSANSAGPYGSSEAAGNGSTTGMGGHAGSGIQTIRDESVHTVGDRCLPGELQGNQSGSNQTGSNQGSTNQRSGSGNQRSNRR